MGQLFASTSEFSFVCFYLRTILQSGSSQPDVQILHPINLNLSVKRNLAGTWYHKIPMVEVKGHLDRMNVSSKYWLEDSESACNIV